MPIATSALPVLPPTIEADFDSKAPIDEDIKLSSANHATDLETRAHRAREDTARQAAMSIREGLRRYPRAVLWSSLMTLTVVMEAYDYYLMGSLFGFPAFAQKFGSLLPNGTYNVSASQQSILKQITKAGQLVGLFITGWMVDKIGARWTMLGALLMLIPIIFFQFFSPSYEALIGAQFLLGIPLAPFLTLSNVYASEVGPACLQPYFTTGTTLGWKIGGFISTGVLTGLLRSNMPDSYRIAFAVQWVWLVPLAIVIALAPESPMWCVKTGRNDRARKSLRDLSSADETEEQIEDRLALLQYTNELEKQNAKETTYMECFRGVNLRRTEIAIMVYASTNLDGYSLANNGVYFFQQAGLSAASAFNLSLGTSALGIATSLMCWIMMTRFGRRPLFVFALGATVLILIAIGGLGIPEPSVPVAWATGGFCYMFTIIFGLCQDPITYSYITEVPSTRLRTKTVVIARVGFLCSAIFEVVLLNYQVNATAWNWRGKAGFFWAGFCFIVFVWAYFRLPETKDRSPAEIDRLFSDGVSARKFASTQVEGIKDDVDTMSEVHA